MAARVRLMSLGFALCALLLTWAAPAQVTGPPSTPAWAPPASAWVTRSWTPVYARPQRQGRVVAWLRRGDRVQVHACHPDCRAAKAWGLLEPLGAVPLALLQAGEPPRPAQRTGSQARYHWGWVVADGAAVFARPSTAGRRLRTEKRTWRLAFVADDDLAAQGWLQRPDGGYMRARAIRLYTPSDFVGVRDPTVDYAFVRRRVALRPNGWTRPARDPAAVRWFARQERLPVLSVSARRVHVAGGWLPRQAVRVARLVQRPRGVGPLDRWIHVDLSEQTLTAAEGDQVRLATVVSTGKRGTTTRTGRFTVYAKTIHSSMRGRGADPYFAEEVPHVLHYDGGRALHGAYWHDRFGEVLSHGCINLAPADAAWLFAYIGPSLPDGWHNVMPAAWPAARPVVVIIDQQGALRTRAVDRAGRDRH
jgi:hypothetical protein